MKKTGVMKKGGMKTKVMKRGTKTKTKPNKKVMKKRMGKDTIKKNVGKGLKMREGDMQVKNFKDMMFEKFGGGKT